MNKRWTEEEEQLLKNGMSNGEVAQLTGRTEKAVEMKRYRMFGVCDAVPDDIEEANENRRKEFRILKIKNLAHKLGVKLFGKDE